MIKIFRGEGVVDGGRGSCERCLKWSGGGGRVIKGSFQKHLKTWWVKTKVVRREEGVLKVSPPLPPGKF